MPGVVVDHPVDGVVRARMDRPAKRNAIDLVVVEQLIEAVGSAKDDVVVIGSTDVSAFSGGADTNVADHERTVISDLLYELYGVIAGHPMPVIASLTGPSVGGGSQIAIAADIRVGGPRASFRFVGPGHGLAVGSWGLPSLVGRGRAMRLCLTMEVVDAAAAAAMGLLDEVAADPDARALELAAHIASLDTSAVARVKAVVHAASDRLAALELERSENRRRWKGSLRREP